MNIFLNEYFGFCFELNFELNHFLARFNEKMNFQNVSNRANLSRDNVLHLFKQQINWLNMYFEKILATKYFIRLCKSTFGF